ncbi:DinB family protein [Spirosoma aerolatum]|uniref:DinB family protein n=1 Tax=Spirosoma aerolatum TaxID=1211326 RepID=UPI0009AE8F5F|nr:DinB family protein [Spirosoma aerolatum]
MSVIIRTCLLLFFLVGSLRPGYTQDQMAATQGEAETYSQTYVARYRRELTDVWWQSEKHSLALAEQMPAEYYPFRLTDSTMTFSEQWRHCILYTCNQLSERLGLENPYQRRTLPTQMTKDQVLTELKAFYTHVQACIVTLPVHQFYRMTAFPDGLIPGWRLFFAMENHIIYHRGQCEVYLRLKGITPKSYDGW